MPEQQNIEYKQSWHDDYLKWVCGFANAIGGVIYIGKDDDGKVVHLNDYAKLLEDIPNKIRNWMGIICDVQLHDEDGNKYISIKVNPYTVAVSLRGRYYYRSGSTKMELTGVELNEFLLKKSGKTWDDVVEEGATIDDIEEKSIAKFIEDSKEKGRMPDTKGLSAFQILEKLKLTEGKKLKRGAIILFGKDPNRFYPNIQVKIGRFGDDASDLKFHEVVEGNIVQMLHEVQVLLNYKFLIRPIVFEGFQRIEKDQYPIQALREMLLNALVHRTYMGATVQLRVFDEKLSIWNEGGLPNGISIEDLQSDHNSLPRNPKIAEACFKAGYIDTWGRGIIKIFNSCKEAGLPNPEIKEFNGGIEVTIFAYKQAETSKTLRNDFGKTSEKLRKEFGSISERILIEPVRNLEFIQSNYEGFIAHLNGNFGITSERLRKSFGKASEKDLSNPINTLIILSLFPEITAEEIGLILGVSGRSVETYIKKLKEENLIERIGGKKEGFWQIIKQV
jgi:ATP-dependent DNA helicase RecG